MKGGGYIRNSPAEKMGDIVGFGFMRRLSGKTSGLEDGKRRSIRD